MATTRQPQRQGQCQPRRQSQRQRQLPHSTQLYTALQHKKYAATPAPPLPLQLRQQLPRLHNYINHERISIRTSSPPQAQQPTTTPNNQNNPQQSTAAHSNPQHPQQPQPTTNHNNPPLRTPPQPTKSSFATSSRTGHLARLSIIVLSKSNHHLRVL